MKNLHTNKRTLLDSLSEFTTEDVGATLVFEATVDIPKTANQAAIITAIETEWTRRQPEAVDIYDNQIDYYNIEGDLTTPISTEPADNFSLPLAHHCQKNVKVVY